MRYLLLLVVIVVLGCGKLSGKNIAPDITPTPTPSPTSSATPAVVSVVMPTIYPSCGDTISENAKLGDNITCAAGQKVGLYLSPAVTLDGNGKSIFGADLESGVRIAGNNSVIKNIGVSIQNATGVGIDASGSVAKVQVDGVVVTGGSLGIYVDATGTQSISGEIKITNNSVNITGNSSKYGLGGAGILVRSVTPGEITSPTITGNVIGAGVASGIGMWLSGTGVDLDGSNTITSATTSSYYLSNGTFKMHNIVDSAPSDRFVGVQHGSIEIDTCVLINKKYSAVAAAQNVSSVYVHNSTMRAFDNFAQAVSVLDAGIVDNASYRSVNNTIEDSSGFINLLIVKSTAGAQSVTRQASGSTTSNSANFAEQAVIGAASDDLILLPGST